MPELEDSLWKTSVLELEAQCSLEKLVLGLAAGSGRCLAEASLADLTAHAVNALLE